MKHLINALSLALAGAALLSGCSRPVATFQNSQPTRYYSQQKTVAPLVVGEEAVLSAADVAVVASQQAIMATPLVAQTKQASEALVSLKATNTTDRRLTKRLERAEKMLTEASQKASAQPAMAVKKATLMERMMLKSIDKKIKKHLAPKDTNALTGYVRLGAIIALVGLLLLLIGNGVGATIGLIALIAGLVLVLLGVLNES